MKNIICLESKPIKGCLKMIKLLIFRAPVTHTFMNIVFIKQIMLINVLIKINISIIGHHPDNEPYCKNIDCNIKLKEKIKNI